ncbi:putative DNA binding protein [Halogeometricum borinquense DSM 11551]|uniref:Predicted DNA binding protein n=2 Tax=Halogeometricum borinquense TaxID=60847 RepID=E4NU85_HALBP|nr:DNA-binding protein [Halogeometricum borinquense]ADQ68605.1 predicted DNA binding protein [Halogeometricum borinquense DSM 11551]ELY25524.1 putative DNA binding protein [Halogeometricum borinquense DSM 11551]RYJ08585.1 DNA-binding protein [Halogeometricum borinquense]
MPPGIRATVAFTTPDLCPIVELSDAAEITVDSVATNVPASDCGECVTEFSADADADSETDLTPIFSHGPTNRYRFTHDDGVNCPCECLGQFGCPVARYVAQDGHLTLVFHAADYEELRSVVAELRDRFPDVDIKRFVRSPAVEQSQDSVFVDRSKLTTRQLEVLQTAYDMGYFERPRRANATEIAAELDINPSTLTEHLAAAESKLLEDIL